MTRDAPSTPAAVVLAAGTSSRFGRPKQLARWREESLVHLTTRRALEAGAHPVVVVLGARAPEVRDAIADLPCETTDNADYRSGQASSVRAGLRKVLNLEPTASACLFLPIDQPRIRTETLKMLIGAWRSSPDRVIQPRIAGRPTSPTLFPRRLFTALSRLAGDRGGSQLLGSGEEREEPLWIDFGAAEASEFIDFDRADEFEQAASELDREEQPPPPPP